MYSGPVWKLLCGNNLNALSVLTSPPLEEVQPGFQLPIVSTEVKDAVAEDLALCVACQTGENSVGHWTRSCCVPVRTLQLLIGGPPITSMCAWAIRGNQQTAIATRFVHHFRMMLREAGAIKHMEASPLQHTDTWVTKLIQRTDDDLPSIWKCCPSTTIPSIGQQWQTPVAWTPVGWNVCPVFVNRLLGTLTSNSR